MKYYLIVGEASGDLHASNLMKAIKQYDADADFRFFGGDKMSAVGGVCVKHYKELAFMGIVPVLMNLRTILTNMRLCKSDIIEWRPNVLILVDYPGFNLSIANYIHNNTKIPVCYYISPKIWAWKERRIKNIKRDVDKLLSILPFEVDFFKKHTYEVEYVGNPCQDAVFAFKRNNPEDKTGFLCENRLKDKPIVALLSGSRKAEIKSNLPIMLKALEAFPGYQPVIAGAPGIDSSFYEPYIRDGAQIVYNQTYRLLLNSHAALVTSGTATLETALFGVPQVVCYAMPMPWFYTLLQRLLLKVKYISLVNLIANDGVVTELISGTMTVDGVKNELEKILPHHSPHRTEMLNGYSRIISILGDEGASQRAAKVIVNLKSR